MEGLEFEQSTAQVPKLLGVEKLSVVTGNPKEAISFALSSRANPSKNAQAGQAPLFSLANAIANTAPW